MDIDYQKTSPELVIDLIKRDNPDLPFELTVGNCTLGKPQVITPVGIRNTSISVNPKTVSGYSGAVNVTYRRLSARDLFSQANVLLDTWFPSATIPKADLCSMLNAKYGLALVPADLSTSSISNTNSNFNISFAATCEAFVGTFVLTRRVGERPVDTLIPEVVPQAGVLVAGVEPSQASDNVADFLTYGIDFTRFADLLSTFTTLTTLPASQRAAELVDYMGMCVGRPFNLYSPVAERNGFQGARIIRYALPNVNVPEANVADYNNVAVITPAAAGGWFAGRFLLHYRT